MADTKITALTALTAADPANDVIPIVDVSDTTMAASGTTKKISVNNILGASGTATLASATITGNLTASQNIYVPASTTYKIGPVGSTWGGLRFDSTNQAFLDSDIGLTFRTGGATSFTTSYQIGATGISTWSVAGTTAMTLNSTGLGVGTTNYIGKIQAAGLIAAADPTFGTSGTFIGAILNNDNTAPGLDLRRWTGGAANHGTTYISTDATGATFFYNGTQVSNTKATSLKMTLDASGNLVVGTTVISPSINGAGAITAKGLAGITMQTVTALATDYALPIGAFAGLIVIRSNGGGGSAVFMLDPNAGAVSISNNIVGRTITFTYSGGAWQFQQTVGPVPSTYNYLVLATQ